jgi:hypothetical protein
MRVSELVKQLFAVMGKHGDIPVLGNVEVVNKQLILIQVGLSEDESSCILPSLDPEHPSQYL